MLVYQRVYKIQCSCVHYTANPILHHHFWDAISVSAIPICLVSVWIEMLGTYIATFIAEIHVFWILMARNPGRDTIPYLSWCYHPWSHRSLAMLAPENLDELRRLLPVTPLFSRGDWDFLCWARRRTGELERKSLKNVDFMSENHPKKQKNKNRWPKWSEK